MFGFYPQSAYLSIEKYQAIKYIFRLTTAPDSDRLPPVNMTVDKYVGVTKAAVLRGVRRQTVLYWIRTGRLHAIRMGRQWVISESDMMAVDVLRCHQTAAAQLPEYLRDKYEIETPVTSRSRPEHTEAAA